MNLLRQTIAVGLVGFLFVPPGTAQSFEMKQASFFGSPTNTQSPDNNSKGEPKAAVVRKLRIVPLEGQGASNIISARTPTGIVVAVLDENDRPVEGATVTVQLPPSGPSGTFPDGQLTFQGLTDNRGQAGVLDFRANNKSGRFAIRVSAKYQDLATSLILHQTNQSMEDRTKSEPKPLLKNWKFYAIVGGVAAGVVTAILLTRSDPSPIGVSAGPVSFATR